MRRASAGGAALPAAAAALVAAALFLGRGSSDSRLFWIGSAAVILAAVAGSRRPPVLSGASLAFLALLAGLVLWEAASISWSIQPARSWDSANRALVYLAFALVGVLLGAGVSRARVAEALAALLGALFVVALAAKVVPALYGDYGRLARLRWPLAYWNELALLADVAVPLALWLAARRARIGGVLLLYAALVVCVLTYSRFGIALAVLAAVVWTAFELDALPALGAAVPAAAVVSVIGLLLHGVADDGQSHSTRVRDGLIFGAVLLVGAIAVAAAARFFLLRRVDPVRRRRLALRLAALAVAFGVMGVVVLVVRAGGPADFVRVRWHEFSTTQSLTGAKRIGTASSGNRWTWWQEEWNAFTGNPANGTGAGTFQLTSVVSAHNSLQATVEPHNTPLQFLGETGIVGFLLYAGALVSATLAIRIRDRASAALALGALLCVVHSVVDIDWEYVATQGPFFLVVGALVSQPAEVRARRPLLVGATTLCCLAALYSLFAPWLSGQRLQTAYDAAGRFDLAAARSAAKQAHSLNPLALEPIDLLAAISEPPEAERLYRLAVKREPANPDTWYDLADFEARQGRWRDAYRDVNHSYTLDPFGQAGIKGGLLDNARCKIDPATCPP